MDVAIAHDRFDIYGGGERVAFQLAREFSAPIYTADVSIDTPDDITIREIDSSWIERWFSNRQHLRWVGEQSLWQYAPELTEFDVIVTSGNAALWYVPPDRQRVIAYTHSPPRWIYDLFQEQPEPSFIGNTLMQVHRTLYQHTTTRLDRFVANSELVAHRIKRYWDVDNVDIVYPPVNVKEFSRTAENTGDYYLALSRLIPAKKFDEIISGADKAGVELKIAGRGPDRDRLEDLAGENVEFLGYVSEESKRKLLSEAKAVIYAPQNEDFGIVPIEAMASGTPVIGVNEGFTAGQIIDGENGILFDRGNLTEAIRRFESNEVAGTSAQVEAFAERFSEDRFCEQMREIVTAEFETECLPSWSLTSTEPTEKNANQSRRDL